LGAGTSGLVSVASSVTSGLSYDDTTFPYLILSEPTTALGDSASEGKDRFMAYQTGLLMRACGARAFETTAAGEGYLPTAELPIIYENYSSIECVIAAIRDNDLQFDVIGAGAPARLSRT
jgi:hypothetical protein